MSKIFDELRKLKKSKSESPPPNKTPPSSIESPGLQLDPELAKPKNSLKLLIIITSIAVPLSLITAFLIPMLILKPSGKEVPRLVLPRKVRPAPEKVTKKPSLEFLIEDVTPSEPGVKEIVEIPTEPTGKAPKIVMGEASPITAGVIKPAEPSAEVIELAPTVPLTSGEKTQTENKGQLTMPKQEKPLVEEAPMAVREEGPKEPNVEVKAVPRKEPPAQKGEVITSGASEAAKERVTSFEETTKDRAPIVSPEEEITAGLRSQKRAEKFKQAIFYQKSDELKKAEAQYRELLKEDPLDAEVHNNLGSIYQELGQYEKAEAEFRKAMLLKPDYLKARNNWGVSLYKMGNLEGALRELQAVLEINPRDIQSLTNLGVVAKKLGDLSKASEAFQKVLQIDATHAEAHYNLAILLEEEGEVAKAVYHYQKFIEFSRGKYASLTEEVRHHPENLSQKRWR